MLIYRTHMCCVELRRKIYRDLATYFYKCVCYNLGNVNETEISDTKLDEGMKFVFRYVYMKIRVI